MSWETPPPNSPLYRPRSLLKAIPSPGYWLWVGGGKRILLIIFNLIYCTYLGRDAGMWRGKKGPLPLPLPLLFYCDLSVSTPNTHTHHPIPLWSGCGSIFYQSPFSLSLTPLLPPPHHLLSLALSWASVQLNLYTLCTHNQPNENPTANTLLAGWSGSVLRRLGSPGVAWVEGLEMEGGFSGALAGRWAGVIVSVNVLQCNK